MGRIILIVLICFLVTKSNSQTYNPGNFLTNLPIVVIKTNGKKFQVDKKNRMELELVYRGPGKNNILNGTRAFDGPIDIELRGSSSLMFPKKSYGFETVTMAGENLDTAILDLPREHDWVLVAAYPDKSLIRNALTYKIFGEMGYYSPRTKLVELVIDDDYRGVYLFCEKIKRDKSRVNIAKLAAKDIQGADLTGGYIIKIDRVNGGDGEGWHSKYPSREDSGFVYFQYHYPDADSMLKVQKDYIKDYVDSLEDILKSPLYKDSKKGYRKFIDVTSFIDFFLINEMSKNPDGYRLSTYMYKDKITKAGGKLKAGPVWDFDLAWKNCDGNGADDEWGWAYTMKNKEYFIPFWWSRFNEDPQFKQDIYCRYKTHRKQAWTKARMYAIIDSMANELSEAQVRNFKRWPILNDSVFLTPKPYPGTYKGEIDRVKRWITNRMSWLDENIKGIDNCPVIVPPKPNGIEDVENDQFALYPNPFSHSFSVNYIPQGHTKFKMFNILGQETMSSEFDDPVGKPTLREINMEELKAGIYFLVIESNGMKYENKVVKIE